MGALQGDRHDGRRQRRLGWRPGQEGLAGWRGLKQGFGSGAGWLPPCWPAHLPAYPPSHLQERQREQERQLALLEQAEEAAAAAAGRGNPAAAAGAGGIGRARSLDAHAGGGGGAMRDDIAAAAARLLKSLPAEGVTAQQLGMRLPGGRQELLGCSQ